MRTPFIIATSIILCIAHFQSTAQVFEAYGKMKLEKGKLDGKIELFSNGGTRESIRQVTGSGKFSFNLDLDKQYVLSFSQEGYVTKKIAINTTAPEDRKEFGFAPFEFQVTLFKQYEGVNFVVFNQPVANIEYSDEIDDFDYDTDYSKSIQQKLEAVQKEVEKKSKEEDKQAKEKPQKTEEPKAKPPPKISSETQVSREDPPTRPRRTTHVPPPPPKKTYQNVVVLVAYSIGQMGYTNLSAYGYINFGDGTGRREITKEQYDDYAKIYR